MSRIEFPGHHAPGAGFEVPLEMLAACHLRVERQCETLRRLVPHVLAHGADASARSAAEAVMRYFDQAAPHHHADEEVDLFPALLEAMAGSDAVCLRELTAGLTADHRALEALWSRVRLALVPVAAGETGAQLPLEPVQAFVDRYTAHLAREDAELLPVAQRLLSDEVLDRVGQAMRHRRGVDDTALGDLPPT